VTVAGAVYEEAPLLFVDLDTQKCVSNRGAAVTSSSPIIILAGVACLLATALPAQAAPHMISVAVGSADRNPQQVAAVVLGHEIVARSQNRLAVDLRVSEVLGSENAVLAGTRSWAVDITVVSGAVVGPIVPEFGVFDVPFLFRDSAHLKAVSDGPIGDAIATKFRDKGLVLLAIGEQGVRNLTNSKHPIRAPADLRGLRIRVMPNDVYAATFRALGAEVIPMEFPLVYSALKEGRIDGQENPLVSIVNNHMQDVQKYLTLSAHFMAPLAVVMNRDSYESLDADDQATVRYAARQAAEASRRTASDSNAKILAQLKSEGMEVMETFDRQAFIDAVKPLEPEFEKRFGKDLLAAIRATR
jgi:tripartite ATP-independent transporter DctP family solute receptor